jgi:hypothetical protein
MIDRIYIELSRTTPHDDAGFYAILAGLVLIALGGYYFLVYREGK